MSKPVSRTKPRTQPSRVPASARDAARGRPITVSGRWIASAIGIAVAASLLCVWGTLCLIFWQGSWQLLYHPAAPVTKTPASAGIAFENVQFDAGQDGLPQLSGWWIPGGSAGGYTAIYLHGATGNLGDTIGDLVRLHAAGLSVLAFDYRGYGQSKFVHPSEERWRQDAEAAIGYLMNTRHIPAGSIILAGSELGANLALKVAAEHRELAGVILDEPIESPANAILNDPRARVVPARILTSDRWNAITPASDLGIPSLWILRRSADHAPAAFDQVKSRKMIVWLTRPATADRDFADALSRWLGELGGNGKQR